MVDGLGSMGEFGVVELFQKKAGPAHGMNRLGIGDDCAVLSGDGLADDLLVTTDALLERVHFLREQISARQLGHKALAVSLSDIAAMGGEPLAAFLSLGLTRDIEKSWIEAFSDGFLDCAKEFGTELMGGDTIASKQDIFINVSVLGKCESTKPIRRSGAKAGDFIYLGRPTGDSAGGLYLLLNGDTGFEQEHMDPLLCAHLTPKPQLSLGQELSRHSLATAMIDVSDGLVQDLGHICRASGLGARLVAKDIPMSEHLKKLGELTGHSPLDWALSGGEDYCLLFCVRPDLVQAVEGRCGSEIYRIGTMHEGKGVKVLMDGKWMEMERGGHDHFSSYLSD